MLKRFILRQIGFCVLLLVIADIMFWSWGVLVNGFFLTLCLNYMLLRNKIKKEIIDLDDEVEPGGLNDFHKAFRKDRERTMRMHFYVSLFFRQIGYSALFAVSCIALVLFLPESNLLLMLILGFGTLFEEFGVAKTCFAIFIAIFLLNYVTLHSRATKEKSERDLEYSKLTSSNKHVKHNSVSPNSGHHIAAGFPSEVGSASMFDSIGPNTSRPHSFQEYELPRHSSMTTDPLNSTGPGGMYNPHDTPSVAYGSHKMFD